MTARSREFYDLDTMWARAEKVDLSDIITPSDGDLGDLDLLDEEDDELWDEPSLGDEIWAKDTATLADGSDDSFMWADDDDQ